MRVETRSRPATVTLHLTDTCHETVVVERYDAVVGGYAPVVIRDETAIVELPAMDGGYDDRDGRKSNVSDPDRYKVIRVRLGDRVLRELASADVRALPHDAAGYAVVDVRCPAFSGS